MHSIDQRLLDLLRLHPDGLTIADICDVLGARDGYVYDALSRLGDSVFKDIETRRRYAAELAPSTPAWLLHQAKCLCCAVVECGGKSTLRFIDDSWRLMIWTGGLLAVDALVDGMPRPWTLATRRASAWSSTSRSVAHWFQRGAYPGPDPISFDRWWDDPEPSS